MLGLYTTPPLVGGLGTPVGGAKGDRTPDLVNAIHALSQLSYGPVKLVGGTGIEPVTPCV
jgi:hypothetical protein